MDCPSHVNAIGRELCFDDYALERGIKQLSEYLDRLSLDSGRLIIFSRHEVENWDDIGKRELVKNNDKQIEVIRL